MSRLQELWDTELMKVAFFNLKSERLRSFLTLLGIVIGIAAIIALVSLGEGLNVAVQEQFEALGTNTLMVLPGGGFAESMFAKLQDDDVDTIEDVRGVDFAAAIYLDTVRLEFKEETKSVTVFGTETDKMEKLGDVGMVSVGDGRALVAGDHGNILIGERIATRMFEDEIHLKQNLSVNGDKLRVVGIMERATHSFGAMFNSGIVTTKDDLEGISDEDLTPFRIIVRIEDGQDPDDVKERVETALEKEHDKKDFQVMSTQQVASAAGDVLGIIQLVLVGIAAISLLVGGIGIMNTMLMTVTERTHEIGVMKAIGATDYRVMAIFLMEAALIGLIGGIIGTGVGAGLAGIVSIAADMGGMGLQAVVSPGLVIGAMAFSMFVGLVSGFIPARRASRLDPVEAMRH